MTTDKNPRCLAALLGWLGLGPRPKEEEDDGAFPYHLRDDFLSPAEVSFYHVLRNVAGDGAVVCPKVSLGDLLYAATGDYGQNRSWMNRVDRKHVDFLVCDPGTMRPVLGGELDDASHGRADPRERDRFVDGVFAAAGLPLARFPAQAQYDTDQVRDQLGGAMEPVTAEPSPREEDGVGRQAKPEAQPEDQDQVAPPDCARCGAPMVLRKATRALCANNSGTTLLGSLW